MIHETGLSVNILVLKVMCLFTVALLSACDGGESVKQHTQVESVEPALPVKEWYPKQKHMLQPQAQFRSPAVARSPQMTPINGGAVTYQPWAMPAPQPVYSQPPPVVVYQGQQYVSPQQQGGSWVYQPPAAQPQQQQPQLQSQQFVPAYQYAPRPWGEAAGARDHGQVQTYSESWPPGGYYSPAGSDAANSGWDTGQYGTVPNTGYYGSVW